MSAESDNGRTVARRATTRKRSSISAFIFGGRMSRDMPLAFQAFNGSHGVYLPRPRGPRPLRWPSGRWPCGAIRWRCCPSATTTWPTFFSHRLNVGRRVSNPPRIFRVNWFRKSDAGKFLRPGLGQNMRVLKWIVDRVHGRGFTVESPIGWMPRHEDIEWTGLDFPGVAGRYAL